MINVIPIFFLSYLKMPIKAWRKIDQIQRRFLWRGFKGDSKIYWISWDDVCKPKSKCGLWVRDLRLVNLSILIKWIWHLISSVSGLWKDVFVARYSDFVVSSLRGDRDVGFCNTSSWWKIVSLLGSIQEYPSVWFVDSTIRKVGSRLYIYIFGLNLDKEHTS